jgi:hypothetical protein
MQFKGGITMKDDKQYGIIREQGEFFDFKPLDEKDNNTVKKSEDSKDDKKDK